jgi:GNAT superfamily N-acetyltransferase
MWEMIDLPFCSVEDLSVFELKPNNVPLLQQFFDANPAYFMAVHGEAARPNEAHDEFHEPLPAGWSFGKRWLLGWGDATGSLAAIANITSDLLSVGVWHIGLFIVGSARHGGGNSHALYRDIEEWAKANGAAWLRLGVVTGNTRAERFWERQGFQEVRRRSDVEMGMRVNTIRVMIKPLRGGTADVYLTLVPRDRPDKNAVGEH